MPDPVPPEPVLPDRLVRLDVSDGVATVTLDHPGRRNALSRRLVADLRTALDAAGSDDSVHAVVLRAEGPAFCAGADLDEALAGGMEQGARDLVDLQRQIVALPVPVVARVHGAARAGGLGLLGAADIVVAARSVTFAFSEVRLALAPAAISLTTLPRMDARAAARTWLTGEPFDADEAARAGLVTTAVDDDALDEAVGSVVAPMRAAPRQGLVETKVLLVAPLLARIDALGDEVATTSARLFASDAAREAMRVVRNR